MMIRSSWLQHLPTAASNYGASVALCPATAIISASGLQPICWPKWSSIRLSSRSISTRKRSLCRRLMYLLNWSKLDVHSLRAGDRLATGTREGHLQLWHVPSGQLLHSLEGKCMMMQLFKTFLNNWLKTNFEYSNNFCLNFLNCEEHSSEVAAVKFSSDGTRLVSGIIYWHFVQLVIYKVTPPFYVQCKLTSNWPFFFTGTHWR